MATPADQLSHDALILESPHLCVAIAHDGDMPRILTIGAPNTGPFDPAMVAMPTIVSTLDEPMPIGIFVEESRTVDGRPGIAGARPDGTAWSPRFTCHSVTHTTSDDGAQATFELHDPVAELALTIDLAVGDTLRIAGTLTNTGSDEYLLARLAPTIPLPPWFTEQLSFHGRWSHEFDTQRGPFEDTTVVSNRSGRTSHATSPAFFAGEAGFGEQRGEVLGVQLAWSGNFEIAAERLLSGQRTVQAGELLFAGEITLAPGESYTCPDMAVAWSANGLGGVSQAFHREVRNHLVLDRPRPVTFNSWEAVYFDHDLQTLTDLADVAADVGAERFVLDDGWFGGRRNDAAGLGDWTVSDEAWPEGLDPLIHHVRATGMEFGLWFEPEMVNPDSDLFRANPHWALTTDGYEPVLGRNQLVLDVGRPEVRDYLFDAISRLLTAHEISYIKWDMNRPLVQGSAASGRAGTHQFVEGFYALVDRLREAFPHVEIESCSSGGGRADLGVLRRTQRIWTSDCNDAVERQHIQRGFSMLFPPEVMGSHIGPTTAHTTLRHQNLGFRAATALFAHMGIEWNLLEASDEERASIRAAIGVYRRWRDTLHTGISVRSDHPDPGSLMHGIVAPHQDRALFAFAQLDPVDVGTPSRFRLPGLGSDKTYRVTVADDFRSARILRPLPASHDWVANGVTATGQQLATIGLQPPTLHPESVLIIEVTEENPGE